jgi:para-nitrobenzyl esterase
MSKAPDISLAIAMVVATLGCHQKAPVVSTPDSTNAVSVRSDRGVVVGSARAGVQTFLGIPYAAPPVGPLRWRPPAPAPAWPAPRDATRRGPACPQPDMGFARATSEDCLTLNLWSPTSERHVRLPVIVWIHGGAFVQGSGGDEFNDGAKLAAGAGVVVVTINYRLGPLGFMAHRDLAREEGRTASPSFGLLDQRAALEWVRRNVREFGGDPDRVTLAGQSAGAWSTCAHLASPGSRGLFSRAIMESGACSDALYFNPRVAEKQGDALAAAVGCTGPSALACLRGKSADVIASALPLKRGFIVRPGVWWGPVIDGVELTQEPLAALREGNHARVPLLIGWNRDEGSAHTDSFEAVAAAEVADFVTDSFGAPAVTPVNARYARASPKQALTDIVTDGVFACGARRVARTLAAQNFPVFHYKWTHALDHPRVHELGATHGVELFVLWDNVGLGIGLSDRERPLSRAMMEAWGRFAATGDPSSPRLPWPRYSLNNEEYLELDLNSRVRTHPAGDVCGFWDDLERKRQGP